MFKRIDMKVNFNLVKDPETVSRKQVTDSMKANFVMVLKMAKG
jgi:hypothetical protein